MKKINWITLIPILVWIGCLVITGIKLFRNITIEISKVDFWQAIFDWFSSNTFSAFMSMVVVMMVQYFSSEQETVGITKIKGEKYSGLSKANISITIFSTVGYYSLAIIDTCVNNLITSILMFLISMSYVILYFIFMRSKLK